MGKDENQADICEHIIPSSFRDPCGFVFSRGDKIYRQINLSYQPHYDLLMGSGLYLELIKNNLIIPHYNVAVDPFKPDMAYCVIQPQKVPFISYPYEWSFSQLKDAGLTTLKIMQIALDYGMWLKDASAYNIQFLNGKPVLIDSLSLEKYPEGSPWIAYRQFCQHFLAPLALMTYCDVNLSQLFRVHLDGISLNIAKNLLPLRAWLSFSLFSHLYLQARIQRTLQNKATNHKRYQLKRVALKALIENLQRTLQSLHWDPVGTEWGDYYDMGTYSVTALEHKKDIVAAWVHQVGPKMVWDLGANVGIFSQIAASKEILTISMDYDPAVIERSYLEFVKKEESNILPLVIDLTNPSPAMGWDNSERYSLSERGPADLLLVLGLVHHLAISHNINLEQMAEFFRKITTSLIIEFIPKEDRQTQLLLEQRELPFGFHQPLEFEKIFSKYFHICESVRIKDSERIMYLMDKN